MAVVLSFGLWIAAVFHNLFSLPAGSPTDIIALAVTSVILDIALIWYWAAVLRWPYNALGFLLVTDGTSANTIPRDTAVIRSVVTRVWEERFGAEVTRATERVWRAGRRTSRLTLIWLLLVFTGSNVVNHGAWALLEVPAIALMVLVAVSAVRSQAQLQRLRQQIAEHLGIPPFDDFPSLVPGAYQGWLEVRAAHKDA